MAFEEYQRQGGRVIYRGTIKGSKGTNTCVKFRKLVPQGS